MKQSLQLRLGQQLTMTPQLQQAIKLLQLSSLDLQAEIQQAVENNPLLEYEDSGLEKDGAQPENQPDSGEDPDSDYAQYLESTGTELTWRTTRANAFQGSADHQTDFPAVKKNLKDHLNAQIDILQLSPNDQLIASSLIDAINEDGYLSTSIEDIQESFDVDLEIDNEEIMAVLHIIQHLDPPGVAAQDLQDCLLLQLIQIKTENSKTYKLALTIVQDYFEELGRRDYASIGKQIDAKPEVVQEAVHVIQQLNPRPGNIIDAMPTEYITPDVYVRKIRGKWRVLLNEDTAPQVRVNDYYASLIRRADDSRDNMFIKNNLQEARWFLKSLSNRNETLLKVANKIVGRQQGFLDYGEESMRPLVLRDIAEAIDMHESTISRVTTQKYMHTPRGIFEFKYFFSSHVSTASGGECSSTAIRAMIKKLVTSEDNQKPFSDNRLAQLLEQKGVKVARRTVAKYRESLLIPPSNERRMRA